MFYSQTKAIEKLREATGLSLATCTKAVKAMPTYRDGCREKVHQDEIDAFVDWQQGVRDKAAMGSRPNLKGLSRRVRARIRAGALI